MHERVDPNLFLTWRLVLEDKPVPMVEHVIEPRLVQHRKIEGRAEHEPHAKDVCINDGIICGTWRDEVWRRTCRGDLREGQRPVCNHLLEILVAQTH